MKKLLFIVPRYHPNMRGWVQGLEEAGIEILFLVAGFGATEQHGTVRIEEVRSCRFQPFSRWFKSDFANYAKFFIPSVYSLLRQIWAFKPDAVIVRGLTPFYIMIALPLLLLRSRVCLYTQGPRVRQPRLGRWLINSVLLAVVSGRWFTPVRRRGCDKSATWEDNRIKYIPFAMRPAENVSRIDAASASVSMIAVGKYEKRKRHKELLIQLKGLPEVVTLTIVGERTTSHHQQYYAALCQMVEELGLRHRVQLLQGVPHASMSSLYARHDLYVQISADEPASVSQLEAMSHGLGVVICSDNGTADYVVHGRNGVVCSPDLHDLGGLLKAAAGSKELLHRWGRESLEIVRSCHSPDDSASQLQTVLNS